MVTALASTLKNSVRSSEDSSLVRQMGDSSLPDKQREAACLELSQRYQSSVVATLSKSFNDPVLALESWNQCMIQFWNKEVTIKTEGSAKNLIFKIAINHTKDELRKINRRVPLNYGDKGLEKIKDTADPFQELEFTDQNITKVREALSQLKPRQREVMEAFYLRELQYSECADLLGIPIGTVMSRIARAKEEIKAKIAA